MVDKQQPCFSKGRDRARW